MKLSSAFSATLFAPVATNTGERLTLLTVTATVSASESIPSLTVKVTL